MIQRALNNTARNTYPVYKSSGNRNKMLHYLEAIESKFVLCPSGLGMDTYRLWESLVLGAIPVVESNAGLDRTYTKLPVLIVRNYSDVNATLLENAYKCFIKHASYFNYDILTVEYWDDLLETIAKNGLIDNLKINHPFRNPYCNYLP